MTSIRATAITLSLLVGAGVAFGAGLIVGGMAAYGDFAGRNAPVSAVMAVDVLKKLRAGGNAAAISELDLMLDGYFMERWSYDQANHHMSGLFWPEHTQVKLMARAARYRIEHPSEHPSSQVRADVAEVARKYADPAAP